MGGSSSNTTPVQTPQSNTAFTGATTGAGNLAGLGSNYSGQQQQLWNMLWGSPTSTTAGGGGRPVAPAMSTGTRSTSGAPASGGGALTNFLNPANLNVTSPTGPFAGAYTNDKTQLARTAAQNAQDIKSQAAQSGFGAMTPSGITADQLRQNQSDLANQTGQAFTTETGNSYNDALTNFWRAANAAQGGAATAQQGALAGTGAATSAYNNLYGQSLGKNTQNNSGPMGVIGPFVGAGGQVGAAAMCVAEGTEIRLDDGCCLPVERLAPNAYVIGLGRPNLVLRVAYEGDDQCVEITLRSKETLVCSKSHTLADVDGGYVTADDSLDHELRVLGGVSKVTEVKPVGFRKVFRITLNGTHTYLSNGIWSME